jgi:hypothetical protein
MKKGIRRAVHRRLSVKGVIVAALALAAGPAVFASAAQAAPKAITGTIAFAQGSPGSPPGNSYFSLYTGFDQPNPLTDPIPADDYPDTAQANSTPNNTGFSANYTLLAPGTTGLKLGSDQSDGFPGGVILNGGLAAKPQDPTQDFDSYEFDVYTSGSPAPELYYSNDTKTGDADGGYYELDGVTGELVSSFSGDPSDLTSWDVHWFTSGYATSTEQADAFLYTQGANASDAGTAPTGGTKSSPTVLNGSTYLDDLLTGSAAAPGGNLVGVYDSANGKIALTWSSVIDNDSQTGADGFNGDYGYWNLVGTA